MTELYTFYPKCCLLIWAEIPLGHPLMENTHKGMNYHYIQKDSLHEPLPFSPIPVSVASKLHRARKFLFPLLLSSWPCLLTKIVTLMLYSRILWEKNKIQLAVSPTSLTGISIFLNVDFGKTHLINCWAHFLACEGDWISMLATGVLQSLPDQLLLTVTLDHGAVERCYKCYCYDACWHGRWVVGGD